jgi:ADP-heptose:LPS heptosyltransferase
MLPELHLVFTASAPQQRIAQQVAEALGVRAHVFSGGLLELIALIAGAAWVLTPDTAVVHIASAVGKPVVGLYGELIKVAEWFPLDTPFALVLSPAMESITFAPPGAVVEAAEWLLSEVVPRGARIPPVLPTTEAVGAGASEVR